MLESEDGADRVRLVLPSTVEGTAAQACDVLSIRLSSRREALILGRKNRRRGRMFQGEVFSKFRRTRLRAGRLGH